MSSLSPPQPAVPPIAEVAGTLLSAHSMPHLAGCCNEQPGCGEQAGQVAFKCNGSHLFPCLPVRVRFHHPSIRKLKIRQFAGAHPPGVPRPVWTPP